MNKDVWQNEMPQQFIKILTTISDSAVMQKFLLDVMTEKEILELSARFEAAKMLTNKETYVAVTEKTKLSSRTVARISDWLKQDNGGYSEAIKLVAVHHDHTPPARV